jgi:hypothetical protein
MKTLALLLFLVGGSAALADTDLLQNGKFVDGISHWDGDCHSPGSSSDDSNATTGAVVKLRSGEWTKINQDFDGKTGTYLLTITYTSSPDLKFSQRTEDYANAPLKMGLAALGPFNASLAKWCLIVVDTGIHRYNYWEITPTLSTGVQTIKTTVQLNSDQSFKKGFFLGFPPGEGSINLQSITLMPYDGSTN